MEGDAEAVIGAAGQCFEDQQIQRSEQRVGRTCHACLPKGLTRDNYGAYYDIIGRRHARLIYGRFMRVQCFAILWAAALCAGPLDDPLAVGRKALDNDGVATAWRLAQKALSDAPESAAAHEFAGEVQFRRGEFAEADAEFKAAVEWNPRYALAWWGLGRVAECASMNKTAVEDFHRAYQLNPKDPRILAAWIPRLRGQEREDALNRYLASMRAAPANGPGDPRQQLEELRQRADLAKALNGREAMALASPYQSAEVPLQAFVSGATHLRTFGLEVMVNGKPARLVLDTGAAGSCFRIRRRSASAWLA